MRNSYLSLLLITLPIFNSISQISTTVIGRVVDIDYKQPLEGVQVEITINNKTTTTNHEGVFKVEGVTPGDYILKLSKPSYHIVYKSFTVHSKEVDLGDVLMMLDVAQLIDLGVVTITDDELETSEHNSYSDNITGLLSSSKDVYQRAVAFNFSRMFFKERGYGDDYG